MKKVIICQPQMLPGACMGNTNLNTQGTIQMKNEEKLTLFPGGPGGPASPDGPGGPYK